MKIRLTLSAAILLVFAAGCGKTVITAEGGKPIVFSGMSVTKSLVTSESDMRTAGLKLYGFEGSNIIFDARDLSFHAGNWEYSGQTEWWLPGNTYDFLGLYPRSVAALRSDREVSFDHEMNDYHYRQQTDLLAGYHNRSYVKGGDASVVVLPMRHLLSQLVIKVVNASDSGTLDVSGVSVTGLYSAGRCSMLVSGGDCVPEWTPAGDRVSDTGKYAGDRTVTGMAVGEENMQDLFQEPILVIPQHVNSEDMKLNITVTPSGSSSYEKSVSFKAATGIAEWEPGKKYTYIASITSNIITFSVTVNDWIEDEEYIIE